MHPHATLRRLIVLLTIAVAACGPGVSPAPSETPGPSVGAVASPTATGLATSAPSPVALVLPTCTDLYAEPKPAWVAFQMRGLPTVYLNDIVATSTGPLGFVAPVVANQSSDLQEIGTVAGNRDLSLSVVPDAGEAAAPTAVVTAIRASLRIGTAPAVTLASGVTGYSPRVTLPDVQGTATIDMAVAWTDGCFTYTGNIQVSVIVELGATVAACPTNETATRVLVEDVQRVEYKIGALRVLLAGLTWSAKFLDLDGGESVAQFSGIDIRQVPIPASAGSAIVVSEPTTLVQTSGLEAAFYRYTDVKPDTYPDPVFNSTGVVRADGSVAVSTPTVPGKYVMGISLSWDSACLTGEGQQWVIVQVT